MMPSFTVPNLVRAPRNELRVENPAHAAFVPPFAPQSGLCKVTDCWSCQMNFNPAPTLGRSRSPRKPRYEFCVSTALRAPGEVIGVVPPRVLLAVPVTRFETLAPGCVASLLLPQPTCG